MKETTLRKSILAGFITLALLAVMFVYSNAASTLWIDNRTDIGFSDTQQSYNITTASQLADIAYMVNTEGMTLEGYIFTVANDIDLGAHDWVPIGTEAKPFKGTILGSGETGKTINNLTISKYYKDTGLVGYMDTGSVSKLTINGAINIASATSEINVGVIVGRSVNGSTIASCTNNASITVDCTAATHVGGIVGQANHSVNLVTNNGIINVENCSDVYLGGIAGTPFSALDIKDAVNNGQIITDESCVNVHVGGIIGGTKTNRTLALYADANTYPMENTAPIIVKGTKADVGGIVGKIAEETPFTLPKNVKNSGNIVVNTGTSANTGTFAGDIEQNINFYEGISLLNSGTVDVTSASAKTGGIIGRADGNVTLNSPFYSEQNISVKSTGNNVYTGGIVGQVTGSITSYSRLRFAAPDVSGGVVPSIIITAGSANDVYTGGLIGSAGGAVTLGNTNSNDAYQSSGIISVTANNAVRTGGLIGNADSTVNFSDSGQRSYMRSGKITVIASNNAYTGGIISNRAYTKVEDNVTCTSDIDVNSSGLAYTGGFIGIVDGTDTNVSDADYANEITFITNNVDSASGGIVGYYAKNGTISECTFTGSLIDSSTVLSKAGGIAGIVNNDNANINGVSVGGISVDDKAIVKAPNAAGIVGVLAKGNILSSSVQYADITGNLAAGTAAGAAGKAAGTITGLTLGDKLAETRETLIVTIEKANSKAGGVIGENTDNLVIKGTSINNCTIKAENKVATVGGSVGLATVDAVVGTEDQPVKVTNVNVTGDDTENSKLGGVTGDNRTGNVCVSTDSVLVEAYVANNTLIGGVIGENVSELDGTNLTSINDVTVTVSGIKSDIGGTIGKNSAELNDLLSTDISLTINGSEHKVGGIIGNNTALIEDQTIRHITIKNNASDSHIGGIAGYTNGGDIICPVVEDNGDGDHSTIDVTVADCVIGGIAGTTLDAVVSADKTDSPVPDNVLNLRITASVDSANSYIGGAVGQSVNTNVSKHIKEIVLRGININSAGVDSFIGGVVGDTDADIVDTRLLADRGLYSVITASGSSDNVGGFAGQITGAEIRGTSIADAGNVRIDNIYSLTISSTGVNSILGGVAGTVSRSAITNFFGDTVAVTVNSGGTANIAGGFVGVNTGTEEKRLYENSIFNLNMTVNSGADDCIIGGMIGKNCARDALYDDKERDDIVSSTAINLHATGSVTINANSCVIGGMTGENNSVIDNFSLTDDIVLNIYGQKNIAGGLVGRNNAKTWFSYADPRFSVNTTLSVIGGLVGENTDTGDIYSSHIDSDITVTNKGKDSQYAYTGGLVGKNTGSLEKCYVRTALSASGSLQCAGGFAGLHEDDTIVNCYIDGSVTGIEADCFVGGFAGRITNGNVENCYSSAQMYASNNAYRGGFAGRFDAVYTQMSSCYFLRDEGNSFNNSVQDFGDVSNANLNVAARLATVTIAQLSDPIYFNMLSGWDFANAIWKYGALGGAYPYPELSVESISEENTANYSIVWYTKNTNPTGSFEIANEADLAGLAKLVSGNVSSYPSVNFEGKSLKVTAKINIQAAQWEPIGSDLHPFEGSFDGQNYLISGLKSANAGNSGLFGVIGEHATVKNIVLEPVSVSGSDNVGALAGTNKGIVSNVNISLKNNASLLGGLCIGGIIGNNTGEVTDCLFSMPDGCSVYSTTENSVLGGIIGSNANPAGTTVSGLTLSFTNGNLRVTNANSLLGGIIGRQNGDVSQIEMSLESEGKIISNGNSSVIGGLIGHQTTGSAVGLSIMISDGIIRTEGNNSILGGAVGKSDANAILANVNVTASNAAIGANLVSSCGGIIGGAVGDDEGQLTSGVWDIYNASVNNVRISQNSTTGFDIAGGVVGKSQNALYRELKSQNAILNLSSVRSNAGGILGTGTDSALYKVNSDGYSIGLNITGLGGETAAGGIVGTIDTSSNYNVPYETGVWQDAYTGINDSDTKGTIVVTGDKDRSNDACIGGVAGSMNNSSLYSTNASSAVSGSGFDKISIGGAVGKISGENSYAVENRINVSVSADVCENYMSGGFAGEITGGVIAYNRVIEGEASKYIQVGNAVGRDDPTTDAGGFVGNINGGQIKNSRTDMPVNVNCDNLYVIIHAGGFAGSMGKDNMCSASLNYAIGDTNVTGQCNAYTGGFAGYIRNCAVSESYAAGDAICTAKDARSGGFAGYVENSSIENAGVSCCYAVDSRVEAGRTGAEAASGAYAGGFAGYNNGRLKEIYADCASVSAAASNAASDFTGTLVGYNYNLGQIDACYDNEVIPAVEQNNNTTAGQTSTVKNSLIEREALMNALTGWEFADNDAEWTFIDNVNADRPMLSNLSNWADEADADFLFTLSDGTTEFTLGTTPQLALMERLYNDLGYYNLFVRTAASKPTISAITLDTDLSLENYVWNPIKDHSGVFDGNGKTLTGIYRFAPDYDGFGFASTNSGTIKNVIFVESDITVEKNSGIVTGINGGSIQDVTAAGELYADGDNIGVIAGINNTDKTIERVTVGPLITQVSGANHVGGAVGDSNGILNDVNIAGNLTVTALGAYIGGVAGEADEPLDAVRLVGDVDVKGMDDYVGGVVGLAYKSVTVSAIGNVTAVSDDSDDSTDEDYIGGIVGEQKSGTLAVTETRPGTMFVVSGSNYIGGAAGKAPGIVSANLQKLKVTGNSQAGGVIGESFGEITSLNIVDDVIVTGAGINIGGVVGKTDNSVTVESIGNVTVVSDDGDETTYENYVGGIAGEQTGTGSLTVTAVRPGTLFSVSGDNYIGGVAGKSSCTAQANLQKINVYGGSYVGGAVGESLGDISLLNIAGDVKVTAKGNHIGGAVGKTDQGVTVAAIGNVSVMSDDNDDTTEENYIGGIIGEQTGTGPLTVTAVRPGAVFSVSGSNYVGGAVGKATGIASANLQSLNVRGISNVGGAAGESTGEISALDIVGTVNVIGSGDYIGGIVGKTNSGVTVKSISNVIVTSDDEDASTSEDYIGGIVGDQTGTGITVVEATLPDTRFSVYGGNFVGGIAGRTSGIEDTNVHRLSVVGISNVGGASGESTGHIQDLDIAGDVNVTGSGMYVGGVAGKINGDLKIKSIGNVTVSSDDGDSLTTEDYIGGIAGQHISNGAITVTTAVDGTMISVSGGNYIGGVAGQTNGISSVTLQSLNVKGGGNAGGAAGQSFGNISDFSAVNVKVYGGEAPSGIAPVSGDIKGVNVANMSVSGENGTTGVINEISTGHKVEDIVITRAAVTSAGINAAGIAIINNGTISNVCIGGGSICSYELAGGTSVENNGVIENADIETDIKVTRKIGTPMIGGITAQNKQAGSVLGSCFHGVLSGQMSYLGGIAALNEGVINTSYASGKSSVTKLDDTVMAGGIAGQNANSGSISKCFSQMELAVNSLECSVGGVAGDNGGNIDNCYTATGLSLYGNAVNKSRVGGIAGNLSGGTMTDVINLAQVKATKNGNFVIGQCFLGGIAGRYANAVLDNVIFDKQLSGTSTAYTYGTTGEIIRESDKIIDSHTELLTKNTLPEGLDSSVWQAEDGLTPKLRCFDGKSCDDSIISRTAPLFAKGDKIVNVTVPFVLLNSENTSWGSSDAKVSINGADASLLTTGSAVLLLTRGDAQRDIEINGNGTTYPVTAAAPTGLRVQRLDSNKAELVSLTTETPSGRIYYTMDGSVPTDDDILYTGPITIQLNDNLKQVNIRAFTACDNYNDSSRASGTYYIESQSGGGGGMPADNGEKVVIDGKDSNIGESKTVDNPEGGSPITVVEINPDDFSNQLKSAASGSSVVVPASSTSSNGAILTAQMVKDSAEKQMTIVIKNSKADYSIPASSIDVDGLAESLNAQDKLSEIEILVVVNGLSDIDKEKMQESLQKEGITLIGEPASFIVSASYGDKTCTVDKFLHYTKRIFTIPEDVNHERVTTAISFDKNGTAYHVPTFVYEEDGKWYASVSTFTNSSYALIYNEERFSDTDGKWYEEVVNEMASRRIVFGNKKGSFAGEDNITRAELAAIMVRALGIPEQSTSAGFDDVSDQKWYHSAIDTAAAYGLVLGRENGTFAPDELVLRQDAMLMIQRAANVADYVSESGGTADLPSGFNDLDAISPYAIDGICWNINNGFIVGYKGLIRPQDNIARSEISTVILRLLQKSELIDVRSAV